MRLLGDQKYKAFKLSAFSLEWLAVGVAAG